MPYELTDHEWTARRAMTALPLPWASLAAARAVPRVPPTGPPFPSPTGIDAWAVRAEAARWALKC